MPLSDCLASRITAGSLAAISSARLRATSRSSSARDHVEHGAEGEQLPRGDGPAGVDHGAHQELRHQPGQVRGRAQRAPVHLGQPERRGPRRRSRCPRFRPARRRRPGRSRAQRRSPAPGSRRPRRTRPRSPGWRRAGPRVPGVRCISLMSTPAQKPRPAAARITALVLASAPAAAIAAARSCQPCTGSALTGGKSMTTSAIPPPSAPQRSSRPAPLTHAHSPLPRRRPADLSAVSGAITPKSRQSASPARSLT